MDLTDDIKEEFIEYLRDYCLENPLETFKHFDIYLSNKNKKANLTAEEQFELIQSIGFKE